MRGQLLYAISGVMRVTTSRETWVVPPSRSIWLPARLRHEVQMSTAVEMRTLYIHPKCELVFPTQCRLLRVSPLLRELVLAAIQDRASNRLSSRIAKIVALIHEEVESAEMTPLKVPLPRGDRRLQHICKAILREPSMKHSLNLWARRVGASERTLARLFSRETGMSFRYWRQQVVLLEAVTLCERKKSVAQIAKQLGYRSAAAFSVMFQAVLGSRPGQFPGS
jgi:AraC-like DNA-binding protein